MSGTPETDLRTVSLARVLELIDSTTAVMQKTSGDDFIGRAMLGGATAALEPIRAAVIKLAELEASIATTPQAAAEPFAATQIVHSPSGPAYCCDAHAAKLIAVMDLLGTHVVATQLTQPELCTNCVNEAKSLTTAGRRDQ